MKSSKASPHKGVFYDKRRNKWIVNIKVDGKRKFLGYFTSPEKAIGARISAEKKYHEPKKRFRKRLEDRAIKLYEKHRNLRVVGDIIGLTWSGVWHILTSRQHEIYPKDKVLPIETILAKYKSGMTVEGLADEYEVSSNVITKRLRDNNVYIRPNRKYNLDHIDFEDIDEEWKAYFFGYVYADGCIRKDGNALTLALQERDRHILEAFSRKIYGFIKLLKLRRKFMIPIKPLKRANKKKYMAQNIYILYICSKRICKQFIDHGCTPRKSLTVDWPKNISEEMMPHFIRGYFDGDGWMLSNGKVAGFIGSDRFIQRLKEYLEEKGITLCKVIKEGKVSTIRIWRKDDVVRLKEYMYRNATLYLKRKHDKFP